MNNATEIIYVEFLTVPHFFQNILPALRKSSSGARLYIFDTTVSAFFLSRVLSLVFGFNVEKLKFEMADVRDDHGSCVYLRVRYHDLTSMQTLILQESPVRGILEKYGSSARLKAYLAKESVYSYDFRGHGKYSELWHALVLIGITEWHRKKIAKDPALIHLYMCDRLFWKSLASFANERSVAVHNMGAFRLRRLAFMKIWSFFAKIELRLIASLLRYPGRLFSKREFSYDTCANVFGPGRLMVEYSGQFNFDRPECVSDLFFLDKEGIQGKDVCLVFNNRVGPVDHVRWRQMSDRNITAVARTLQSSLVDEAKVPVFRHEFRPYPVDRFPAPWRSYMREYQSDRDYWSHFFRTYGIKLFTSWYNDSAHIAMSEAITDVGGISSTYQLSYESNPSPYFASGSDVIFGFFFQGHDLRLKSGSEFKYYVTTGYLGDGRFKYLHPLAQNIRRRLLARGAEHIIAYFDENTVDDGRWFAGHKMLRDNYAFWLQKVLEDRELGIIFKPRIPGTLYKRLGPVAALLRAAEKTGRCYVFNEEVFREGLGFSLFSPAAAAMAADISIQDMLWAGTAGIEAALSGARTLVVDREGCPQSPLYKLGPDVVFQDWPSVWKACQEDWKSPGGNPALGNWSSMINDMDPFRDGLAAKRMSAYLKELLEGLRSGMSAKNVMEQAAQRYAQKWGKDKVQLGRDYSNRK